MTVVAQLLGTAFSHVEQGVELREAGGLLFQLAFVGKRFGGLGARSLHLPAGFFEARAALVSLRAHLGDGVVQPRHGACRITAQLAFVLGFADDAHLERRAHAVERQLQENPGTTERHGPVSVISPRAATASPAAARSRKAVPRTSIENASFVGGGFALAFATSASSDSRRADSDAMRCG
ncbi:MAG: hypothetical protein ACLTMP_00230 [Eggerthella lenta]